MEKFLKMDDSKYNEITAKENKTEYEVRWLEVENKVREIQKMAKSFVSLDELQLRRLIAKPQKNAYDKARIELEVAIRTLENATTPEHYKLLCEIIINLQQKVNIGITQTKILPQEEEIVELTRLERVKERLEDFKEVILGFLNKSPKDSKHNEFTHIERNDVVEELAFQKIHGNLKEGT